jgi:hypothetical protein
MTLAFGFVTPWLLAGLLAAGIPLVLHLLSSVRAREVPFPTLRFLQLSMEKTARRRRVRHWLLMILRGALLAVLAAGLAQPITEAVGGWVGQKDYAAVIVLDNSFSMGAGEEGGTNRFTRARTYASALLGSDNPPALAGLVTTNGGLVSRELTGDLTALQKAVEQTTISAGRAPLAQQVAEAIRILQEETSIPQKSIYVFSDMQRASFEELARAECLASAGEVHLMIVNTARAAGENVGISDVEVSGRRIVNSVLEVTATVVNSCPGDRRVKVGLRVEGRQAAAQRDILLTAAGAAGSVATVRFRIPTGPKAGVQTGEVYLANGDDLATDDVRRFSITISGRVKALMVRGRASAGTSPEVDPGTLLRIALDPWGGQDSKPWSITPRLVEADAFRSQDLASVDAAFFSNVPTFTQTQADAIGRFVSAGGTAFLFLGPDVQAEAYNKTFFPDVLPGKLLAAVGQVGPEADAVAVDNVDTADPYLKGLFREQADYLAPLVQRYFRLDRTGRGSTVLMRLAGGDPLMLTKHVGKGRITLCATTASGQWSNFLGSGAGVVVSMVIRACLLAPQSTTEMDSYLAGRQVAVRPAGLKGPGGKVQVTSPAGATGQPKVTTIEVNPAGQATFADTWRGGTYRWRLAGEGAPGPATEGVFVVNPHPGECDLRGYKEDEFKQILVRRSLKRVYVAQTPDEASAAAADDAKPKNWWDVLVVVVILLLILEAVAANRLRSRGEIPPYLKARSAA